MSRLAAPITFDRARSRFRWDAASLRYRNVRTGRFVKASAIRRAINQVANAARRDVRELARQVASGEMNVATWQSLTAGALKNLHLATSAAASGGFAQMTQADYGRAGAVLRFQYERLERFARDVARGFTFDKRGRVIVMSERRILARSDLYAASGSGTYENGRRAKAAGVFTEERRVLSPVENCPTCIEEAGKGWQPTGTLRQIGDSECLVNCQCQFRFR